MTTLDVMCVTPHSSGGWGPVTSMAALAAKLFGTQPQFVHPRRPYGALRKMASVIPQRRSGTRGLLLIASHPGDLLAIARLGPALGRYGSVGAWIFDSFWDDRIPYFARHTHGFDHVWITDGELVERYSTSMNRQVGWLPWGSDTLAAAALAHDGGRTTDVLRLGRQPAAWDDDSKNQQVLTAAGLSYQGRFPDPGDGEANQAHVRTLLADAKVVLASTPTVDSSDYTHPQREYISGRFTDALAAGTRIAGVVPRCMAADLFPREAWLPLDVSTHETALPALRMAVADYEPSIARTLRAHARKDFDWRHRFAVIADSLGANAPALRSELDQLDQLDSKGGRSRVR